MKTVGRAIDLEHAVLVDGTGFAGVVHFAEQLCLEETGLQNAVLIQIVLFVVQRQPAGLFSGVLQNIITLVPDCDPAELGFAGLGVVVILRTADFLPASLEDAVR